MISCMSIIWTIIGLKQIMLSTSYSKSLLSFALLYEKCMQRTPNKLKYLNFCWFCSMINLIPKNKKSRIADIRRYTFRIGIRQIELYKRNYPSYSFNFHRVYRISNIISALLRTHTQIYIISISHFVSISLLVFCPTSFRFSNVWVQGTLWLPHSRTFSLYLIRF